MHGILAQNDGTGCLELFDRPPGLFGGLEPGQVGPVLHAVVADVSLHVDVILHSNGNTVEGSQGLAAAPSFGGSSGSVNGEVFAAVGCHPGVRIRTRLRRRVALGASDQGQQGLDDVERGDGARLVKGMVVCAGEVAGRLVCWRRGGDLCGEGDGLRVGSRLGETDDVGLGTGLESTTESKSGHTNGEAVSVVI